MSWCQAKQFSIYPRGAAARFLAGWHAFDKDERGAILFEAAIVIPILVMIFVGMVEFSQAFTARRRAGAVASTTADLVAQAQSVTTADLNDIVSVSNSLMAPYPVAPLSLTITSVGLDANNQSIALWSCSWSAVGATPACVANNAPYALPAGLVSQQGNSVIVSDVTYLFTPPVGRFLLGGVTFNPKAYFKPRLTPLVTKQ